VAACSCHVRDEELADLRGELDELVGHQSPQVPGTRHAVQYGHRASSCVRCPHCTTRPADAHRGALGLPHVPHPRAVRLLDLPPHPRGDDRRRRPALPATHRRRGHLLEGDRRGRPWRRHAGGERPPRRRHHRPRRRHPRRRGLDGARVRGPGLRRRGRRVRLLGAGRRPPVRHRGGRRRLVRASTRHPGRRRALRGPDARRPRGARRRRDPRRGGGQRVGARRHPHRRGDQAARRGRLRREPAAQPERDRAHVVRVGPPGHAVGRHAAHGRRDRRRPPRRGAPGGRRTRGERRVPGVGRRRGPRVRGRPGRMVERAPLHGPARGVPHAPRPPRRGRVRGPAVAVRPFADGARRGAPRVPVDPCRPVVARGDAPRQR